MTVFLASRILDVSPQVSRNRDFGGGFHKRCGNQGVLLPDHQYLKAQSLGDCLQQLRDNSERAQVATGGTDVIFNMRLKLFEPDIALSIRPVPEPSLPRRIGRRVGRLRVADTTGTRDAVRQFSVIILRRGPASVRRVAGPLH